MENRVFSTKADAMDYIEQSLGDYRDDFDLDSIFNNAFVYDQCSQGFILMPMDEYEYWDIVKQAELS